MVGEDGVMGWPPKNSLPEGRSPFDEDNYDDIPPGGDDYLDDDEEEDNKEEP